MREIFQLGLLYQSVAGGEENILAGFFEIADRDHGAHGFSRLQSHQIADVLPFAGGADVGDLIHLKPVDAAGVGEDENEGMRGGDEQVLDEILVARLHTGAPLPTAALHAVGRDRRALHVAAVAHRDRNLLVGNQVFEMNFRRFVFDLVRRSSP